jgi:putative pyruvate formate lyase activating enzyme
MINRRKTRIRIDDEGYLEVVDPGFDSLDILRAIEPGFQIKSSEIFGFTAPRFLQTRKFGCGINVREISEMSAESLWDIHSQAMEKLKSRDKRLVKSDDEASVLDIKIELSHRLLSRCSLCAKRCGINRTLGEIGNCGLGMDATVSDYFTHIAEESPINPSLLISLAGCGLRCRYCQQWELLEPASVDGETLDDKIWDKLPTAGAKTLSFIGGNPDESIHTVLRFLGASPLNWNLPVVWNCHGYGTDETIALLDGIIDVYIPDFKYGNDDCGTKLSQAKDYPSTVKMAISKMLSQKVPVIVRILVMPGHFECCHFPILDYLAGLNSELLFVSVRHQYCPDWKISPEDGEMWRRATQEEVTSVITKALSYGISLIE